MIKRHIQFLDWLLQSSTALKKTRKMNSYSLMMTTAFYLGLVNNSVAQEGLDNKDNTIAQDNLIDNNTLHVALPSTNVEEEINPSFFLENMAKVNDDVQILRLAELEVVSEEVAQNKQAENESLQDNIEEQIFDDLPSLEQEVLDQDEGAVLIELVDEEALLSGGVFSDIDSGLLLFAGALAIASIIIGVGGSSSSNNSVLAPPNMGGLNAAASLDLLPVLESINEGLTEDRVEIAEIVINDDGIGINELSLSGEDADLFEIDDGKLYLKGDLILDPQLDSVLDVTVSVDDVTIGGAPDDSQNYSLQVVSNPEGTIELRDDFYMLFSSGAESLIVDRNLLAFNDSFGPFIPIFSDGHGVLVDDFFDLENLNIIAINDPEPGFFETNIIFEFDNPSFLQGSFSYSVTQPPIEIDSFDPASVTLVSLVDPDMPVPISGEFMIIGSDVEDTVISIRDNVSDSSVSFVIDAFEFRDTISIVNNVGLANLNIGLDFTDGVDQEANHIFVSENQFAEGSSLIEVRGGDGDDKFFYTNNEFINPELSSQIIDLVLGEGNDRVLIVDMEIRDGGVLVDAGLGDDEVRLTSIDLIDNAEVIVNTGLGDDSITLEGFTYLFEDSLSNNTITIDAGDGNNHVTLDAIIANNQSIAIQTGDGDDTFSFRGIANVFMEMTPDMPIDVLSGEGNDLFRMAQDLGDNIRLLDFNLLDDQIDLSEDYSFMSITEFASISDVVGGVKFELEPGSSFSILGDGINMSTISDDIFIF